MTCMRAGHRGSVITIPRLRFVLALLPCLLHLVRAHLAVLGMSGGCDVIGPDDGDLGGDLAVDFLNAIADSDDEEPRELHKLPKKLSAISDHDYVPHKIGSFSSVPSMQKPVCRPGDEESETKTSEEWDDNGRKDDIDLASIRAVYKEGITSSQCLDGLLAANGDKDWNNLLMREEVGRGIDGFTVNNVILQDECAKLIAETEKMGYSFWNPDSTRTDYRNADTIEIINDKFAQDLWSRIKHLIVPSVTISPGQNRWSRELEGKWVAVGLNPNMLFNRYHPGGHFSPHTDGYTIVDFNTRSMYSALFYLNDCTKGGATRMMEESGDALGDHVQETFVKDSEGRHRFEDHRIRASVSPRAGGALFFFQDTLHEGEPVGDGCMKYMIRSDILYQREPKLFDEPRDREAYRLFREAELAEAEDPNKALRLFKECCRLSPGLAAVYGL